MCNHLMRPYYGACIVLLFIIHSSRTKRIDAGCSDCSLTWWNISFENGYSWRAVQTLDWPSATARTHGRWSYDSNSEPWVLFQHQSKCSWCNAEHLCSDSHILVCESGSAPVWSALGSSSIFQQLPSIQCFVKCSCWGLYQSIVAWFYFPRFDHWHSYMCSSGCRSQHLLDLNEHVDMNDVG